MYKSASPSSAVVVGIDGSQWAVNAALWAIDEAISRDVPLRLLYVVEPRGHGDIDPEQEARDLACADVSVRRTLVAVESAEKPVKIEWEVLQGHPPGAVERGPISRSPLHGLPRHRPCDRVPARLHRSEFGDLGAVPGCHRSQRRSASVSRSPARGRRDRRESGQRQCSRRRHY